MNREHIDIIEVFLKKDLDIPLTENEQMLLSSIDEETKESILKLVNSHSYIEELVKVMNKIKEKSIDLSLEEQQLINEKCKMKKQNLEKLNFEHTKNN